MMIVDAKQIREVSPKGVVYTTETGETAFIDFSVCYANYVRKTTSPDDLDHMTELHPQSQWDEEGVKKYIESRIAWKEVAYRNVLGQPWADGPYIEFHTEPPIRFKFATQDDFSKVIYKIRQFAWKTLDLS